MESWRGLRTQERSTRIRHQPWSDPRVVLGVLLVLGATVLGASVVAAADDSEGFWAVSDDVLPGSTVQRDDLVEVRARVPGDAAATLLRTDEPLPADLDDLAWAREVAAGSLVDRSDVEAADAGSSTQLPLAVRSGAAPDDLRAGDRVDVWVGPAPEAGPAAGDAARVLVDVAVESSGTAGGPGGSRTVLVDVGGVTVDGEAMASLTAGHVTLVRRA